MAYFPDNCLVENVSDLNNKSERILINMFYLIGRLFFSNGEEWLSVIPLMVCDSF